MPSPKENPSRSPSQNLCVLKVVLLGDSGVGKTCLRSQFVHHVFSNAYKATIGGDYLTTTVDIHNDAPQKISLQVWDTAGQERFNSISQAFYRGADVAVLVYDITNYESFLSISEWLARFLEHCHVDKPAVVIVGNKSDKASERCIDRDEVQEILARNRTVRFDNYISDWDKDLMEISCKSSEAVEAVFRRVALAGMLSGAGHQHDSDTITLDEAHASSCAC